MASTEQLERRVANLTSRIANMKGELNPKAPMTHAYYQGLRAQLQEVQNELRSKNALYKNNLGGIPINTSIYNENPSTERELIDATNIGKAFLEKIRNGTLRNEDVDLLRETESKIRNLLQKHNSTRNSTPTTSTQGGALRKYKFPRRFSKKYCMKTSCKKMGFTQRASCRPYKNCYRRSRKTRKNYVLS